MFESPYMPMRTWSFAVPRASELRFSREDRESVHLIVKLDVERGDVVLVEGAFELPRVISGDDVIGSAVKEQKGWVGFIDVGRRRCAAGHRIPLRRSCVNP